MDNPISDCSIAYIDFKLFIMKYIIKRWQESWDQQIHNRFLEIHSHVGKTHCYYSQIRKEQVVLTRYRIGHSRLTHSYLIKSEQRSECIPRISNYSLKHVLICQTFYKYHRRHNVEILKTNRYALNIRFYPFNVSFICTNNPFVL